MKLVKRSESVSKNQNGLGVSRRSFMKNTSLAAGGAMVGAGLFAPSMMRKAEAKSVDPDAKTEVKRTICSHCSVGCGIYAEVQNGVWTGQEPAFDTHLMPVATVQKVRLCVNTATVNVV
ncbi:formate dehydrogenase-O, major subunit [Vibrio ishigakensis]|uniref:Formate dehydrogenase-O, major subunit n=1 Tax=Vibrio ishigakensis TaxID=1481914 RepID=A0A0B8NXK9_9VIBR|nr:formate dehydrogenase-O, major subunit [Vibrio ishigakensis]